MRKSVITCLALFTFCVGILGSASPLMASDHIPSLKDTAVHAFYPMASYGQSRNALGIRGMGTTGLTYKHFNSRSRAIEIIMGFANNSFSLTGLYEKYANPFQSNYLDLYYGLGGHAVIRSNSRLGFERDRFEDADDQFGLGVDGILGLELIIPNTPLAMSLDVKPFVEVVTSGNVYFGFDPGFGIKIFF